VLCCLKHAFFPLLCVFFENQIHEQTSTNKLPRTRGASSIDFTVCNPTLRIVSDYQVGVRGTNEPKCF
jgi:hypothetical protein